MHEGFTALTAPVYSKTLVDERGQPLLLRMAPVVFDPACVPTVQWRDLSALWFTWADLEREAERLEGRKRGVITDIC